MRSDKVYHLFEQLGAVINDSHIVYTSGRHGSAYLNKDVVYAHPYETFQVCRALAEMFIHDQIEAVVGPAMGGVIISQWIGFHLNGRTGKPVLSLYADKSADGDFVFKRGYQQLIVGKRTLVVEDIINTGLSVKKVIALVRKHGGEVVGVGAFCNRGDSTAKTLHNIPKLNTLFDLNLDSWSANECPLCKNGVNINTIVGKGAEFITRQNQPAL